MMFLFDRRRVVGMGLGAALLSISDAMAAPKVIKGRRGGGTSTDGTTGGTTGGTTDGTTSGGTTTSSGGVLRVVITLGATTYEVRQDTAQDLGAFVSDIGGFTQRCLRAQVPGLPLTVFFRPDLGSDRAEVVFELGRLFNAMPANLGAYSAAIYRDTQLLTTISVPAHYWFSRWRWQSAPRPVVANVDTLISQGLLPPYTRSADALNVAAQTYTIMGLAGVNAYMPQTGERDDIGMVTEPQAQFIRTSSPTALATLRAQAEAAGTVPWHLRDENTGAPLDFRIYPGATAYSASAGSPYIPSTSTPVAVDSAHQPALAYVPYMLTGDPYHLEDLQFQATWNWASLPPAYRPGIPQPRAFAWNVRTLAQCARITPATTPAWLLPQSYWMEQLAAHRMYLETNYVESSDPVRALFRATANYGSARDEGPSAPQGTWVDPWQDEFVASVLGWVVSMGFGDWRYAFDWLIGGTLARTSGRSGWVRAHAVPYRMIVRATNTSAVAQSWTEAWQLTQSINGCPVIDPDVWYPSDMTYLTYARGALTFASRLGVSGAAEALSWASAQLSARGWGTAHKWRVG